MLQLKRHSISQIILLDFTLYLFFLFVIISFSSQALEAKEVNIPRVVERTSKAIVNIKTEEWQKNSFDKAKQGFFKKFTESESEEEIFENIGSGVVLDAKGIIVTNEHLVSRAINIRVKFINGKEYEAYVLASDPEYDIALLQIEGNESYPYLKAQERKNLEVGERAIVIGNPYGLSSTVTVGVISAIGRNLRIENRTYVNLIQTDAAINPGSSGGALLDADGNILGIVTAIYGEGKGIGFAIPIDDVMSMLSEFLGSEVQRPLLGFFFEKKRTLKGSTLRINSVITGSPAQKYGLKAGDNITEFHRRTIREGTKIHNLLRSIDESSSVRMKISRHNELFSIKIPAAEIMSYIPAPLDEKLCGMRVRKIIGYPKLKFKLKDREGVVITKVFKNSIGDKSGLRPGDIILKINNKKIISEDAFTVFMVEGLKRNYILYQIKRGDNVFFLPVKFDTLL